MPYYFHSPAGIFCSGATISPAFAVLGLWVLKELMFPYRCQEGIPRNDPTYSPKLTMQLVLCEYSLGRAQHRLEMEKHYVG